MKTIPTLAELGPFVLKNIQYSVFETLPSPTACYSDPNGIFVSFFDDSCGCVAIEALLENLPVMRKLSILQGLYLKRSNGKSHYFKNAHPHSNLVLCFDLDLLNEHLQKNACEVDLECTAVKNQTSHGWNLFVTTAWASAFFAFSWYRLKET